MITERYLAALQWAAHLHQGQTRKGTTIPYLAHVLAVSSLVMEYSGGEDAAIAGLLHDAIEDTGPIYPGGPGALRQEIMARFGPQVLQIVEDCTDAETIPKPPWQARKAAYLRHLRESDSPDALLVSCADKLHNARAILTDYRIIGEELWERFTAGRTGTLWYYEALVDAFRANPLSPPHLPEELERVVRDLLAEAA